MVRAPLYKVTTCNCTVRTVHVDLYMYCTVIDGLKTHTYTHTQQHGNYLSTSKRIIDNFYYM